MKKLVIPFLTIALFVAFSAQSQSRAGLKGPAAKNYKPWMNKEKSNKVYVVKTGEVKKGPEAKNAKVWSVESKSEPVLAVDMSARENILKGPEAKNAKPWAGRSNSDVQVADAKE